MSGPSFRHDAFPPLPVTAAGMCTALGGLLAGCAAARAGIQRISEIPVDLEGGGGTGIPRGDEPRETEAPEATAEAGGEGPEVEEAPGLLGHRVRDLPEGYTSVERLARLGAAALEDLFSEFPEAGQALGRLGIILCLPSGYLGWARARLAGEAEEAFSTGAFVDPDEATRMAEARTVLLPDMLGLGPPLPPATWVGLVPEDQAGFAEGLFRAAALLSQGRLDSCLVGGVDSRLDSVSLTAMSDMGLLQTPDFPAGFIPGEAGAFLLLGAPSGTGEPLAWIDAAASGVDPAHRFSGIPPQGSVLTETVRLALGNCSAPDAGVVVLGSVNGSPWNSNEWGYLITRMRNLGEADHWFPVASFGEVGASLGPLGACMAIRGFARDYAGSDRALIVLSSESGRKGAVVVRRPPNAGGAS